MYGHKATFFYCGLNSGLIDCLLRKLTTEDATVSPSIIGTGQKCDLMTVLVCSQKIFEASTHLALFDHGDCLGQQQLASFRVPAEVLVVPLVLILAVVLVLASVLVLPSPPGWA